MNHRRLLAAFLAALVVSTAWAQNKRDTVVKKDKQSLAGKGDWVYNDLDKAVRAAKAAKKPLLVVFR